MTLCIAAMCEHNAKNAIVLCCDWQGTYGGVVKSDDFYKMRWPSGEFSIMLSGTGSNADELIALLNPVIASYDTANKSDNDFDIRISQFLEDIRRIVRKHKYNLVNHYFSMKYNVSYPDFLKSGSEWFPPHLYDGMVAEIGHVRLGCELILAYADDTESIIIEIREDGKVNWIDNYTCIGSGSIIARAVLSQEDFISMSVMDCAARVQMAKQAALKDPYVGDGTAFAVLINGEKAIDFTKEGLKFLYKRTKRIIFPKKLLYKESFFYVIGGDPSGDEVKTESGVENVTRISDARPS
jgi:20S proteasome alpha/beta subunit